LIKAKQIFGIDANTMLRSGQRAAEHGVTASLCYFLKKYPHLPLKEASIRFKNFCCMAPQIHQSLFRQCVSVVNSPKLQPANVSLYMVVPAFTTFFAHCNSFYKA